MPNKDGSYGVKIIIRSKGTAAYISTRFRVDDISQWQNGKVVKNPAALYLNSKLRELYTAYMDIYDAMPVKDLPAVDVKRYLESRFNRTNLVKDFAMRYIERLISEGRKSYAQNMTYTMKYFADCFGEDYTLQQVDVATLTRYEQFLISAGNSNTTVNIRMTHLKALLNAAVVDGMVEYKIFPFRSYKMPCKNVRQIWISRSELKRLRDAEFSGPSERRYTVARDLFMLSFYLAGINLTDLMDARLDGDTLTFARKKTATRKLGEKEVSLTIQPEARCIIDKYINDDGKLDFGYNYRDYEQFRSFVTKSLNRIGVELGFELKLMFYSARKTFVQFGQEIGVPLYVLEYAIGHSNKEANSRPIFNYMKMMRTQADWAIRVIIDYSCEEELSEDIPMPSWAKREKN